jgi:hypothetical protein
MLQGIGKVVSTKDVCNLTPIIWCVYGARIVSKGGNKTCVRGWNTKTQIVFMMLVVSYSTISQNN